MEPSAAMEDFNHSQYRVRKQMSGANCSNSCRGITSTSDHKHAKQFFNSDGCIVFLMTSFQVNGASLQSANLVLMKEGKLESRNTRQQAAGLLELPWTTMATSPRPSKHSNRDGP